MILFKVRNIFIYRLFSFICCNIVVINKELLDARKKISDKDLNLSGRRVGEYDCSAQNSRKPKGKDNKMRKQLSGVLKTCQGWL